MAEREQGPLSFGPDDDELGGFGDPARDERGSDRSPGRRPESRYTGLVAIAFVIVAVVAGINAVRSRDSGGVLGASFSAKGWPLPQFAVPDARGTLTGDANIAQDNCSSSRLPCPSGDRRRSACRVRGRGIIRVCDFFQRPLVLSFWFSRGGDCDDQQDVVDAVAARHPRVGFLSLNIRDSRRLVARDIRGRGWRIPVGRDPDGAVSNLYRVGGCPTFLFAYAGGIGMSSNAGRLDLRELDRRVQSLERSAAARERRSR
jgi:hypothetical protein